MAPVRSGDLLVLTATNVSRYTAGGTLRWQKDSPVGELVTAFLAVDKSDWAFGATAHGEAFALDADRDLRWRTAL